MATEIDRARSLLAILSSQGLLTGKRADLAYETWAARHEEPFSRFLIDQRLLPAKKVRHVLRMEALEGLPDPKRFPFERYQDLLLGRLGVEAELLSSKLLHTVRAVQDKKAAEGKLRRLADLLPAPASTASSWKCSRSTSRSGSCCARVA